MRPAASSIWKSLRKKYVLLCGLCGGLCLALGVLYLAIYFVLGRYTTSMHYFQTMPLYIPSIVVSLLIRLRPLYGLLRSFHTCMIKANDIHHPSICLAVVFLGFLLVAQRCRNYNSPFSRAAYNEGIERKLLMSALLDFQSQLATKEERLFMREVFFPDITIPTFCKDHP